MKCIVGKQSAGQLSCLTYHWFPTVHLPPFAAAQPWLSSHHVWSKARCAVCLDGSPPGTHQLSPHDALKLTASFTGRPSDALQSLPEGLTIHRSNSPRVAPPDDSWSPAVEGQASPYCHATYLQEPLGMRSIGYECC